MDMICVISRGRFNGSGIFKMRLFAIAATTIIVPLAAFAAAEAPTGSTPTQQTMVIDWARYSMACKGGAMDGDQQTSWGYCGTAEYLLYRLSEEGICMDTGVATYFSSCTPGSLTDPLAGYEF